MQYKALLNFKNLESKNLHLVLWLKENNIAKKNCVYVFENEPGLGFLFFFFSS